MRQIMMRAIGAAMLAAAAIGCTSFLTSEQSQVDQNNPSQATKEQIFTAVQAAMFTLQEGNFAFIACLWTQQCQGVGGRFVNKESQYSFNETTTNPEFGGVYSNGGLVDIRNVERLSETAGDLQFKGIAEVWEAIDIGTAADVFGDIPYRDAVATSATPEFDPQLQIYDDVQALLDQAISDLAGAGPGPGVNDLVYGGDVAMWTEAAYTLKARFYMHTVEARGTAEYQKAIDNATKGISAPTHDLRTFHTTATQERNIWYQFNVASGFGEDLAAGASLVNLMNARNDPRRAEYFSQSKPGLYGGVDVFNNVGPNGISLLEGTRNDPTFRQPLVTNDENLLILAEANFVLRGAGAAQPFMDQARDNHGLPHAAATLQTIMEDKYIALFQNTEVWSDYKRTCIPHLTPYPTPNYNNQIPGRFYYGSFERSTNPNTPSISDQNAYGGEAGGRTDIHGFRNPNDPNPCP